MPTVALALAAVVVGVLGILAGVIFHDSDKPVSRMERLINAVRGTGTEPTDQPPADLQEPTQQASSMTMIEASEAEVSGAQEPVAQKSAAAQKA